MEGSKCQVLPNISYKESRTFDVNLEIRLTVKIDDLSGDQIFRDIS